MAVDRLFQVEAHSLTEVANATIHLLTHSHTVRPENVRQMADQDGTCPQRLTELWDTLNIPWEERMGFAAKMLDLLPEGQSEADDERFEHQRNTLNIS